MKNLFIPLSFSLITLCAACGNSGQPKETAMAADTSVKSMDTVLSKTENAVKLDTTDTFFFQQAAYGGMVEVESSSKILQSSKNQNVLSFAAMMTKDHGDANKQLKDLAMNKGYILPPVLPESKLKLIRKMDELKEEGKNEYYIQLMIDEHNKAVDLFSVASRSKDAEISQFAKTMLPTLKMHYDHITKIDTLFKTPKANQGDDPLKISNRKKQ